MTETRATDERTELLREFLAWYDSRFPKGQSHALPGLTLYQLAESARALVDEPLPPCP